MSSVDTGGFEAIAATLAEQAAASGFRGADPFDLLASPLARPFLGRPWAEWGLIAMLQAGKHAPVNLRPLFGVPALENPKALALFLLGACAGAPDPHLDAAAPARRLTAAQGEAGGWGYPFPWQARAFYVPPGVPNMVTTAFSVRALLAHERAAGRPLYDEVLERAGAWMAGQRMTVQGKTFLRYIPGEEAVVHNASLAGAWALALLAARFARAPWAGLAHDAACASAGEQSAEGAWTYGHRGHHGFIDNFHTAFNLEFLDGLGKALGTGEWDSAVDRGLAYYLEKLFDPDGAPRYYAARRWPVDIHACASAVAALVRLRARDGRCMLQAGKTLQWTVANLWDPAAGAFSYQLTRGYRNRVPYLRWGQAWMYHALRTWLAATR